MNEMSHFVRRAVQTASFLATLSIVPLPPGDELLAQDEPLKLNDREYFEPRGLNELLGGSGGREQAAADAGGRAPLVRP